MHACGGDWVTQERMMPSVPLASDARATHHICKDLQQADDYRKPTKEWRGRSSLDWQDGSLSNNGTDTLWFRPWPFFPILTSFFGDFFFCWPSKFFAVSSPLGSKSHNTGSQCWRQAPNIQAVGPLVPSVAREELKHPSQPQKRKSWANQSVSPLTASTELQLQGKTLNLTVRFEQAASETHSCLGDGLTARDRSYLGPGPGLSSLFSVHSPKFASRRNCKVY